MMIGSTVLTEAVPTMGVVTPMVVVPGAPGPQALNMMTRPTKTLLFIGNDDFYGPTLRIDQ
jgi:hypothetical protein